MVSLIILCSLIGSVALILVCVAIAPVTTITPPAIVEQTTMVAEEEYSIMQNDTVKNNLREGIVEKSIEVLRSNGMSEEEIKKKMMDSFSLDEETIDKLLSASRGSRPDESPVR